MLKFQRYIIFSSLLVLFTLLVIVSLATADGTDVFLSNSLAGSQTTYVIQFEASVKDKVDSIEVALPAGTVGETTELGTVILVKDKNKNEDDKRKEDLIRTDVTFSVDPLDPDTLVIDPMKKLNLKPGDRVRIELFGLTNPEPADNHEVVITTRDKKGNSLESASILFSTTSVIVTGDDIADDTITGANILDGSLTSADILDESLTGLDILDGSVALADLAIGSVDSAKIVDGSVTNSKILDGSLTSSKMGAGEIGTSALADNAVTGAKILDGSLTGLDILDGSVANADLAPNSVNSANVVDGSLTGGDIADGSVANADLASNSVNSANVVDGSLTGLDVFDESLTGLDILNGTLTGLDIFDGSLTGLDIANGSLTGFDIFDGSVANADLASNSVNSANVVDGSLTGGDILDGSITGLDIADGTIVNADVNVNAAIAGTKIAPDFGSQKIVTTGNVTVGTPPGATGKLTVVDTSPGSTAVVGTGGTIGILGLGGTIGVSGAVNSLGSAGLFVNTGGGNLLLGQAPAGTNQFRVNAAGRVFANGGFQLGGADFAESMAIVGDPDQYKPSDLLVIDKTGNRRLALAQEPYSTRVAGIYSTNPGILATSYKMDDPRLAGEIPLGIVGIVPCKASTENGSIEIGDLLVSSSTAGHAMKGTDRTRMLGAIVGKALEPLASGKGVIQVLLTLQ